MELLDGWASECPGVETGYTEEASEMAELVR
jgi:hypothetical protein